MGDDSRSKRILADLSSALRRDPQIDEFDFIPCPEPVVNRSPVVLENHKLGLQTWSIKILYNYVYNNLMKTRGVKDLKSVHEFSCAALLLNPECYSIWNLRKELVMKRFIRAEDDLKLATLIQTKHPKSPETFIQRRWLLQQLFPCARIPPTETTQKSRPSWSTRVGNSHASQHQSNGNSPHDGAPSSHTLEEDELTERQRLAVNCEMEACEAAAARYPSNYNAWSHRIWVLQRVARLDAAILEEELEKTKVWVRQHISDHSGFNYRHFLLSTLSCSKSHSWEDIQRLVQDELDLTSRLIQSFPGHEAVWYHRRAVISISKAFLENAPNHIHIQANLCISNTDCSHNDTNSATNGRDPFHDEVDAEVVEGGSEGEWLLLKDYSSHTSPPNAKSPRTDYEDQRNIGYNNVYSRLGDSTDCGRNSGGFCDGFMENEASFMECAYKSACKGDRPLQQRCLDRHKSWLDNMQ